MTGSRRLFCLLAIATAAFAPSATPAPSAAPAADEVFEAFQRGVDLLQRGQNEEALRAFQEVLALDPSQEAAYELWQKIDGEIWLKMLVLDGDYELVAKRFLSLAEAGRQARENDPDGIRALLAELATDDVAQRHRAIQKLSASHGEYAVPHLLYGLANPNDGDRRVIFMQALVRMGGDVVPPMIEGLGSSDAFLRRNIALTLGYIADPRAAGVLAALAGADADAGVREAAAGALAKCGGTPDALAQLLALGDAYHRHDPSVLQPHHYSDVVWAWDGKSVVPTTVPRFLYPDEMAKKAYWRALAVAPGAVEALAGIARASVAERSLLEEWTAAGANAGDWSDRLAADELAAGVAGAAALDLALGWALDQRDLAAAIGLARALGAGASQATPNLVRALEGGASGAIRGEAAVALGRIAHQAVAVASPAAVAALGEAAAREVLQIAAVIDGDEARRAAYAEALAGRNMTVNAWPTAARGLVALRSIPGIDVILAAESLPDLTLFQVLDEVRSDPRFAETPVLVITADPEKATELYGEKVQGFLTAPDMDAVGEAMTGGLNRDRAAANDLAARAAQVLSLLAGAGVTDVRATAGPLAGTLASRPDEVVLSALAALRAIGGADCVAAIAAVVTDTARSDEARVAAAEALAGVLLRAPEVDEVTREGLLGVCRSDALFAIRAATARALGRVALPDEVRAEIMRAVRGGTSQ
ncbi:MAG: HEAT repeat domain-containing protein [Planctomycetota bacterium]